jgi:hypothetical protein
MQSASQRHRSARCKLDCHLVEHRKRTRQRKTNGTGIRIRRGAEIRRASAERLALCLELNVNFESDYHLVAIGVH